MIWLKDTTFIIPIKIEHKDRLRNAETVLGFLNHHVSAEVFIVECTNENSKLDFLSKLSNLRINHIILKQEPYFHRTKYLNMMLDKVKTKVVVNYDIDVVLDPNSYLKCSDMILDNMADLVYPYGYGNFQVKVSGSFDHLSFRESYEHTNLGNQKSESKFGHCMFYNTDLYRRYGGENENFISYGAEDIERAYRFYAMGRKIIWAEDIVYHFEHFRGQDSSSKNKYYSNNANLLNRILKMKKEKLDEYYSSLEYMKSYRNICWNPV